MLSTSVNVNIRIFIKNSVQNCEAASRNLLYQR